MGIGRRAYDCQSWLYLTKHLRTGSRQENDFVKNIDLLPLEKAIAFNAAYRARWRETLDRLSPSDTATRLAQLTRGMDDESRELCVRQLEIVPFLYPSPLSPFLSLRSDAGEALLPAWTREQLDEFGLLVRKERNLQKLQEALALPETPLDELISHSGLKYIHSAAKQRIKAHTVIDAGAYIGDTARLFETVYGAGCVYALEPDSETFDRLKSLVREWDITDRIVPVNVATAEHTGQIPLWGHGVGASTVRKAELPESDAAFVSAVSIDDLVDEHGLTDVGLIKLDVEGAELSTIRGAMKTIAAQRPILLISIYHTADDFFEIKPLLEKAELDYVFMVRKLTTDIMKELVLICIQKEDHDKF
jgi:FkbM family methyltransferase